MIAGDWPSNALRVGYPTCLLSTSKVGAQTPGREMSLDTGWCPHVVARQRPLVLDDVCAWTRFAANPAVGALGIRSYLGAPLIWYGE